jgi:hypothetical protein
MHDVVEEHLPVSKKTRPIEEALTLENKFPVLLPCLIRQGRKRTAHLRCPFIKDADQLCRRLERQRFVTALGKIQLGSGQKRSARSRRAEPHAGPACPAAWTWDGARIPACRRELAPTWCVSSSSLHQIRAIAVRYGHASSDSLNRSVAIVAALCTDHRGKMEYRSWNIEDGSARSKDPNVRGGGGGVVPTSRQRDSSQKGQPELAC